MIGRGLDCLEPLYVKVSPYHKERLRVRCGHCITCKMFRSRDWSTRLYLESKLWDKVCFVTLTYNNVHLPQMYYESARSYVPAGDTYIETQPELLSIPTVWPDDLRNFFKRLRKSGIGEPRIYGETKTNWFRSSENYLDGFRSNFRGNFEIKFSVRNTLKYFGVGEYGLRGDALNGKGRPHYHLILFGVGLEDKNFIERAWSLHGESFGFIRVDDFPRTDGKYICKYVAGYIQKKLFGDKVFDVRLPEFMRCSQHLGESYFLSHLSELNISDTHPFIDEEGKKTPIPRRFRQILVQLGRLPLVSAFESYCLQKDDYKEFIKMLQARKVEVEHYFESRRKNMKFNETRKLKTRLINGDFENEN